MSGSIDPTKGRKKTLGIAGLGPGPLSQKLSTLSITSRPLGQISCANTGQTGATNFFLHAGTGYYIVRIDLQAYYRPV